MDEELEGLSHGIGNNSPEGDLEPINIDCLPDILKIDMNNISFEEVERYNFGDLDVAYQFYYWFGRRKGFSIHKSLMIRNRTGDIFQQTYVCSRAGFREDRGLTPEKRKRRARNETRCGCQANFRVHVDIHTRRWYVTVFEFGHNHVLLDGMMCGLLAAHRKLSKLDVQDIRSNNNVGIRPYQMYGAMANASGGFH